MKAQNLILLFLLFTVFVFCKKQEETTIHLEIELFPVGDSAVCADASKSFSTNGAPLVFTWDLGADLNYEVDTSKCPEWTFPTKIGEIYSLNLSTRECENGQEESFLTHFEVILKDSIPEIIEYSHPPI